MHHSTAEHAHTSESKEICDLWLLQCDVRDNRFSISCFIVCGKLCEWLRKYVGEEMENSSVHILIDFHVTVSPIGIFGASLPSGVGSEVSSNSSLRIIELLKLPLLLKSLSISLLIAPCLKVFFFALGVVFLRDFSRDFHFIFFGVEVHLTSTRLMLFSRTLRLNDMRMEIMNCVQVSGKIFAFFANFLCCDDFECSKGIECAIQVARRWTEFWMKSLRSRERKAGAQERREIWERPCVFVPSVEYHFKTVLNYSNCRNFQVKRGFSSSSLPLKLLLTFSQFCCENYGKCQTKKPFR